MIKKKYVCTCIEKCKGGKEVSRSTYQRHKSYRLGEGDAVVSSQAVGMSATIIEVNDSDSDEEVENTVRGDFFAEDSVSRMDVDGMPDNLQVTGRGSQNSTDLEPEVV